MSSTISSIGGYSSMMMMGMGRPPRPDSTKLAEDLFSQIDSSGNGYITQSDLESAFSKLGSSSASSGSTSAADEIFSKLDSNGDGKVTQDEMTAGIKALSQALDSQFQSMRMSDAMSSAGDTTGTSGMNGMPPPPPPPNDAGFTKDELQSQLDQIGSSSDSNDSQRASLLTDIINNFSAADANGDGKVTFQEAMAYEQSSGSSSSTSTSSSTDTSSSSTASSTLSDAQLMLKILQLLHAYGDSATTASTSTVTATA